MPAIGSILFILIPTISLLAVLGLIIWSCISLHQEEVDRKVGDEARENKYTEEATTAAGGVNTPIPIPY